MHPFGDGLRQHRNDHPKTPAMDSYRARYLFVDCLIPMHVGFPMFISYCLLHGFSIFVG